MRKTKIMPLLVLLCFLCSAVGVLAVDAGSVDITTPSTGDTVDLTDGITIVIEANTGDEVLNCALTAPSLSTLIVNDTSGDTNFNYSWTPANTVKIGSNQIISVICGNSTENFTDSVTISIFDFATSDMSNVVSDVIGTGGVNFKYWIPFLVLVLLFGGCATWLVKFRKG